MIGGYSSDIMFGEHQIYSENLSEQLYDHGQPAGEYIFRDMFIALLSSDGVVSDLSSLNNENSILVSNIVKGEIRLNTETMSSVQKISVFNSSGSEIYSTALLEETISLPEYKGIAFVRIDSEEGTEVVKVIFE